MIITENRNNINFLPSKEKPPEILAPIEVEILLSRFEIGIKDCNGKRVKVSKKQIPACS